MILIINSSSTDLEFVLDNQYKSVATEKQSLALPTETEKFITECGSSWSDISAIGVVVGPGSFTGIRIGIAYAKGLAMGLGIPVVPINAFELYLAANPDAFVAIESGHGDFFVGAKNLPPCTMSIDELETKQMEWPRTVGHKPFDLKLGTQIVKQKLQENKNEPVIPMYLRPSYVETNKQGK
ncbi:MAG: tRNA (adenosine(37)-N6)-threonylcarbamoyltransferase complex dimerization subunit type 1 TsaB [Alphaproteobacteria bacterium]|nr:tRNA (adenosine(37)-N6)-threonylcarbamoyltransferase complex dimerization subunit type 1 TsaB [Alphaproteobacteria bacterium]MBP5707380.1 tRNA (adenosine(37)-N6)-threonylcarbamoyltransferase complex dimerization subunit type 1 TsaB [Alphaproteobacteria bacterium]